MGSEKAIAELSLEGAGSEYKMMKFINDPYHRPQKQQVLFLC